MNTYSVRFSLEVTVETETAEKAIPLAESMILNGDFSIIDICYMDTEKIENNTN